MLSSQAAVDKLLSTGVVSRVDLDETEGKKRWVQSREKMDKNGFTVDGFKLQQ